MMPNEIQLFKIMNTNEALKTRARYQRNLLKGFTDRWQAEYLQSLQEVSCNKNSKCSDIQVGEVVLLKDENTPKQMWRLGHVHNLVQSTEGLVRTVTVCTNTRREGKQTLLRRAVKHFVPLEIKSTRPVNIKVKKEL